MEGAFALSNYKQVVNLLFLTSRQLKTGFNNKLAELNLTFAQLQVLNTLAENERTGKKELTPAAIAESLGYDRPTVTGILDRLEKHGNITRLVCPHDRRCQSIALTDQARALVNSISKFLEQNDQLSFMGFSEEEALQLESMLKRVSDNLEQKQK